jgi:hypothetical protein
MKKGWTTNQTPISSCVSSFRKGLDSFLQVPVPACAVEVRFPTGNRGRGDRQTEVFHKKERDLRYRIYLMGRRTFRIMERPE